MRDVEGVRLEVGEVAARLVLFGSPHAEISTAMRPPWPSWMHRLYELEAGADDQTRPAVGEVSVGAALHALAERLRHRLDLAAFVVNAAAELGWSATLSEDSIIIRKLLQPDLAVDELERAGILGPMSKLCELDERGLPRIYQ